MNEGPDQTGRSEHERKRAEFDRNYYPPKHEKKFPFVPIGAGLAALAVVGYLVFTAPIKPIPQLETPLKPRALPTQTKTPLPEPTNLILPTHTLPPLPTPSLAVEVPTAEPTPKYPREVKTAGNGPDWVVEIPRNGQGRLVDTAEKPSDFIGFFDDVVSRERSPKEFEIKVPIKKGTGKTTATMNLNRASFTHTQFMNPSPRITVVDENGQSEQLLLLFGLDVVTEPNNLQGFFLPALDSYARGIGENGGAWLTVKYPIKPGEQVRTMASTRSGKQFEVTLSFVPTSPLPQNLYRDAWDIHNQRPFQIQITIRQLPNTTSAAQSLEEMGFQVNH